jgi:hypothetical protein
MVLACARNSAAGAVKLKDLMARQVQKALAGLLASLPARCPGRSTRKERHPWLTSE